LCFYVAHPALRAKLGAEGNRRRTAQKGKVAGKTIPAFPCAYEATSGETFLHISGLVAERFPEMGDLPLSIEFAPNNKGLHIYRPERPVDAGDKVTLPPRSAQAVCKAALTTSCCGTGPDVCCAAA